ncbi:SRPBCC family protein [Streptomyces zagrosensis]|uniref:Uncharacterized protein YndB with AHSA1/START domain n=1 Tax=Streptomyces zagrosensis TaxID=1042984 RepID=A0A7W9Q9K4_9ACTN|nr:SRPBCC family protein [Streptomyces zagrosensis]MBB5936155.1 uncharacterized protein YndB with AHSA1/START domain [Streptomyces zagrosensis]
MAERHVLIQRPPQAVWDVLSDGNLYSQWVVGTHDSKEADPAWPAEGANLRYSIRIGPTTLHNETVVRICEEPHTLELESKAGWLGTARIAIRVRRWATGSLVTLDEHPLSGPGARLHNSVIDAFLQLRHRSMLDRLAKVVESRTPAPAKAP